MSRKVAEYAARGIKLYPEDNNVYINMANVEMADRTCRQGNRRGAEGLKVLRQEPDSALDLGESVDRRQSVEGGEENDRGVAGDQLPPRVYRLT